MPPTQPTLKESPLWLFRVRLGGLTGLMVGGIGGILISAGLLWLGIALAVLGAAGAALALVFEVRTFAGMVGARRGAAGSNVAVQVILAMGLLLEINGFSFFHYRRLDWTSTGEHTLAPELRRELGKLRGETTIVVNVRHNFGLLGGNRDQYDHAAERVVIDKVEEVAEELRESGPQFRVFVLDVKDKRYGDKLKQLIKRTGADDLKKAIQESNEDSIFILADKKVQRLGFQDLFQLDKEASQSADDGNGNLVMHYQGAGPLVRRILNLDNRQPRIAVGVVHEALSTQSTEDRYTMAGAAKVLADHGFETEDILLKDLETQTPKAVVRTFDEGKYEEYDFDIVQADKRIAAKRATLKKMVAAMKHWQTAKLDVLSKELADQIGGRKLEEAERERAVLNIDLQIQFQQLTLERDDEFRKDRRKKLARLNVADLAEQRRLSDLRAKLNRKLERCDLLILPRMTIINPAERRVNIPSSLYALDSTQEKAIEDFLKKGKPVLALFGPTDDSRGMPADRNHGGQDRLETMMARLGIGLDKETFLHDADLSAYGVQRGSFFIEGTQEEVPPARFAWVPSLRHGKNGLLAERKSTLEPSPIAESMRLTLGSVGEDQRSGLRIRFPRPVEYLGFGATAQRDPTFLMTDPNGWTTRSPFPTEEGPPKKDPKAGGQVGIGVAVEAPLPPDWKPEARTVRVAAIGQGGIFVGKQLSPVRGKLLLDVSNWLLGRDDMLNRPQEEPWSYPRVHMSDTAFLLWQWGTRFGIPVLFAYLGIVVLMIRAMR